MRLNDVNSGFTGNTQRLKLIALINGRMARHDDVLCDGDRLELVPHGGEKAGIKPPDLSHDPPLHIKDQPTWLLWRMEAGRKVPIDPTKTNIDGIPIECKWKDPKNLVSFEKAKKRYLELNGYCDGIAFVIPDDEVGVDLDAGFDEPESVIERCNSYCEASPSGTGYHMLIRGKFQGGKRVGKAEIYGQGSARWFTYTGHVINNLDIQEDQEFIDSFVANYIRPEDHGPTPAATTKEPKQVNKDTDYDDRLCQAKSYLDKCPGSIQGKDASGYCFKIALSLVHGFQLNPSDAFELLCKWGEKEDNVDAAGNYYPWTQSDIEHKINSALNVEYNRTPGDMLYRSTREIADKFDLSIFGNKDEYGKQSKNDAKMNPTDLFVGWDELQEVAGPDEADWFIPGWIEFGSLAMLSGEAFSGKSHIITEIAGAMAAGQIWSGKAIPKVPFLIIDLENQYRILKNRLLNAVPVDKHELNRLFSCVRKEQLNSMLPLDPLSLQFLIIRFHLKMQCEKSCVVIDTMRSAFDESDLDMDQMRKLLYPLQRLSQQTNTALILLHHRPKNKAKYSGATSIAGALDSLLVWERDEHGNGKLTLEGTRNEPQPALHFKFNVAENRNTYLEGEVSTGNEIKHLMCLKPKLEGQIAITSGEITAKLEEFNLSKGMISQLKKSWRESGYFNVQGKQGSNQTYLLTDTGRQLLGLV